MEIETGAEQVLVSALGRLRVLRRISETAGRSPPGGRYRLTVHSSKTARACSAWRSHRALRRCHVALNKPSARSLISY
jgi:hypothetical protein